VTANYIPQELIRRKRNGDSLSDSEIAWVVERLTDGSLTDGQIGAFAMAIYFQGLSTDEQVSLTRAMTRSGTVLEWSDIDRPVLDKHSTGGVGDKVSLILAPIVAACGGAMPMISGRGLGHTGGTLDKLDAIPGYQTAPSMEQLRQTVSDAGCAIVAATADLAPADKRFYALRDTTGTVEAIPLIVSSILSKKLAAGANALVMDVKVGSGAFMSRREEAQELAQAIQRVADGAGLKCSSLLTDMNQVLGHTAGNAVEVAEAIEVLVGRSTEARLVDVSLALSAELLRLGGLARDKEEGLAMAQKALDSGAAAEIFSRMVHGLGGPADLIDRPEEYLPQAQVKLEIFPEEPGTVNEINVREVGVTVLQLGGGRLRPDDAIDYAVGVTDTAAIGETVGDGERPLATVHARSESDAEHAGKRLREAYSLGLTTSPPRMLLEHI
jgi:thymidine phosphorylase